jgi:predicted DNA-binding WGR domain protein
VWVTGCEMWTRYGKIGSAGSKTVKTLADEGTAKATAAKVIHEKANKGYVEKTEG